MVGHICYRTADKAWVSDLSRVMRKVMVISQSMTSLVLTSHSPMTWPPTLVNDSNTPPNSPIFSTPSLQEALFQCAIHLTVSSPSSPWIGAQYVFLDASSPKASSIFFVVDSFEESFLGLQYTQSRHLFRYDIVQLAQCSTGHPSRLHSNLTLASCSLLLVPDCFSELPILINAGHFKGEYTKTVAVEVTTKIKSKQVKKVDKKGTLCPLWSPHILLEFVAGLHCT